MTHAPIKHLHHGRASTRGRALSAIAGLAMAALALAGCSSESAPDEADEPTQESQQEADGADDVADAPADDGADDGADGAGGEDGGSEGEVDQACLEATAMVGLIQGALQVRAEQGPLDEQDIEETFGDFHPYAGNLSAEAKADYDTYYDAAVGAIGLEDAEVDAILESAEVQSAIKGLTQMELMSACM